jgi:hypothetical protein
LNKINLMLAVPVLSEKINRFHPRPNHRYQFARPPRQEGRIAIVTDAGLDAVDAAASGAIVVAGRVSRERSYVCADDRRFKAFARTSVGILPIGVKVEGAAYGEVVWSWHPLLMSSQRRRVGPTGLKTNLNPLVTVTRGIRRRGEREVSRKAIAQGMPECLR